MTTKESPEALERLLDRALHGLPLRRAPVALESRVFGELQRRAALAWWRRSFAHWPPLARAVFLVICGALIKLAFLGGATAVAGVRSLSWAQEAGVLVASAGNLAALLAHTPPPAWAYEAIAVCAVLYAILFGLGAVVYRALYLQPLNGR
ncbi:MAG TPA: hypothetical protein VGI51_09500 [Steroidobacteraceae bacterium]|jgi:hypothetical protein